jgi:hypothetical protein
VCIWERALISYSTKQKVNSSSLTEVKLNCIDGQIGRTVWVKWFTGAQGFTVKTNVTYQDNQSTTELGNNGTGSSGRRTCHFDVKLCYLTDLIEKGQVKFFYCPTDAIMAIYITYA